MQPRAEAIGFIFNPMFGMSGKLAVRNLPTTAAGGRDRSIMAICPSKRGLP
jgi:hypothetical protein